MFLQILQDEEKEAFIDLARLAAGCNGSVSDEEEIMIEQFCAEMGMDMPMSHAKTFDEVIGVFKNSPAPNRKTVVLEIIGLLVSDGAFDETEKSYIEKIASALDVSNDQVEEMMELTGRYLHVLNDLLCVIQSET
jgi:tellurite resistance protein